MGCAPSSPPRVRERWCGLCRDVRHVAVPRLTQHNACMRVLRARGWGVQVKRFIDLCTTFSIPVVSFVDEPGFMIGREAELAGTIRHGTAVVLTAQACPVPWAAVHVRKVRVTFCFPRVLPLPTSHCQLTFCPAQGRHHSHGARCAREQRDCSFVAIDRIVL